MLRRSFFDEDDNELKRIDYQGEFLFVNGKLDKIFTEEGYYQPNSVLATKNSPPSGGAGGGNSRVKKSDYGTYFYTLKDHLGHTRVVIDEEENVIQETAYYPYGGIIAGLSTKTNYNYLYTGKEFIDSLGVNWYDHHARYYDPEVGRWFAIDPALQAASPYMAMGNNPMIYIDVDGRTWKIFKKIGDALETAWDGFWDAANQFAEWADKAGVPSVNFGAGMGPEGQIQPVGNINGYPLFGNEAQYEAAAQNAVDAMNDARSDYNNWQVQASAYQQHITNNILQVGLQQGSYTGGYANSSGGVILPTRNGVSGPWAEGASDNNLSNAFVAGISFESAKRIAQGGYNLVNNEFLRQSALNGIEEAPLKVPKGLKIVGKYGGLAFAFYGAYDIDQQWRGNQISTSEMIIEQISNGIGVIPVFGTGWSVGWNLGKSYGPSTWYGDNDYKYFE